MPIGKIRNGLPVARTRDGLPTGRVRNDLPVIEIRGDSGDSVIARISREVSVSMNALTGFPIGLLLALTYASGGSGASTIGGGPTARIRITD